MYIFQVTVPQLDEIRRGVLLEFFIKHFIEVAKKCIGYESFQHAMIMLNHCRLLVILMGEDASNESEARRYKERIASLIDKCEHAQLVANRQNSFNNINHLSDEMPKKKKKSRPANLNIVANVENTLPKRVVFENGDVLNESSEL